MSYSKKIIDLLTEKNLSEGTINNYMRILKKLNDDTDFKNLKFLKDKDNIMKIIGTKKKNTQRNYLIAVCSVLKQFKAKTFETLYKFYFENMMNMNKILKQEESTNTATETQKKNWVDQTEIKNKLEELKKDVLNLPSFEEMSKEQYKKVLQFCVLSLYTLTAPRRNKDYQEMVVVKNKEKTEDLKYNYLVVDDSEFIFNDYKTSKVEGQKIIKIPKELKDNLNIYFKYKSDSPFLLSDYNGKKLKNINAITYLINDIFDKNVGCSMLRHIYLSNKYGSTLEELKKDSSDMSHSLETQKNYIKI